MSSITARFDILARRLASGNDKWDTHLLPEGANLLSELSVPANVFNITKLLLQANAIWHPAIENSNYIFDIAEYFCYAGQLRAKFSSNVLSLRKWLHTVITASSGSQWWKQLLFLGSIGEGLANDTCSRILLTHCKIVLQQSKLCEPLDVVAISSLACIPAFFEKILSPRINVDVWPYISRH